MHEDILRGIDPLQWAADERRRIALVELWPVKSPGGFNGANDERRRIECSSMPRAIR